MPGCPSYGDIRMIKFIQIIYLQYFVMINYLKHQENLSVDGLVDPENVKAVKVYEYPENMSHVQNIEH